MSNTTGDKHERDYIEMESQCNGKSEEYFNARAMLLDTTHNRGLFKAGFERAWRHNQSEIQRLQAELAERDKRYEQVCDDWNHEAAIRKADLQKANERIAESKSAKASAVSVLNLIQLKFKSGNDIPVERITLTRDEVEQFLSAGDTINKPESGV